MHASINQLISNDIILGLNFCIFMAFVLDFMLFNPIIIFDKNNDCTVSYYLRDKNNNKQADLLSNINKAMRVAFYRMN